MTHPYQSLTRSRDRRLAQQPSNAELGGVAACIIAGCFIFILGCVLYPLFARVIGGGQ